jgi:hypothetical protein
VKVLPVRQKPRLRGQRAILNFTPGPQRWTSPLGVNLATRDI